ncbi:MAG: biopolymer transporter ExbD [Isosphaeraceae bacterium]|nr:biopolymer transporter ExbD [Isosphaeraceae bacterium]
MDSWDVFHSDRLEVERGLSTGEVRAAVARGDLHDDDLIRPGGTSVPWARLSDMPALLEPEPAPPPPVAKTPRLDQEQEFDVIDDLGNLRTAYFEETEHPAATPPVFPDDDEDEEDIADAIFEEDAEEELGEFDLSPDVESGSRLALPAIVPDGDGSDEEFDPQDEDEAAAEFTLSRGGPERVEELDLAAMVDVAFQLVLFFLVTATTVLYKSLEVPKPNPESPANAAAQQGKSRSLDDLKEVYIVVEIDPAGSIKIDREPVAADMASLVERLRSAREKTGRKAMLLSADYATQHRNSVLAYDAANEIGLNIAIARPVSPAAPPPATLKKPAKG